LNGGIILRIFRPINEAAYDAAWRSDLFQGDEHILRCFLEAPAVRETAPELQIPDPLPHIPKHTFYSGFEFEGAVAHLLFAGGAYPQTDLREDSARLLAREFVDALGGKNRLQLRVWRIEEAWTDWFNNIAWDSTFVVQPLQSRLWVLFCVTDTD
jgi:hypothetical protein